jgi:hypothetical protein
MPSAPGCNKLVMSSTVVSYITPKKVLRPTADLTSLSLVGIFYYKLVRPEVGCGSGVNVPPEVVSVRDDIVALS